MPILKFKARLKQLLGSLLLDIALPAKVGAHLVGLVKTAEFSTLEVAICILCIYSVFE
jgi:hypothetical protein